MIVNQLFHKVATLQCLIEYFLSEVCSASFDIPIVLCLWKSVIMKRKTIHESMEVFWCVVKACIQNSLCPMIIIHVRTTANLCYWLVSIVVSNVCLITSILICIVLRSHISAATPVFITNSKIVNYPWLLMTVLFSEISHWRNTVECHIFHPFAHFANST